LSSCRVWPTYKNMSRLHIPLAALCAAIVCACLPEAVPMAPVESVKSVCVCDGERTTVYGIGEAQRALLRDEFEAWKQAGFEDFDDSFSRHVPTLLVIGKTESGVSYQIDFRPEKVIVSEEKGKMVDGSRYAREATAADKRFRQFLLDCIADGKLPRKWSSKLRTSAK